MKKLLKQASKWAIQHFESFMSPKNFQSLFYRQKFQDEVGATYPNAQISYLEFAIEFLGWILVLHDESLLQRCTLEELVQMQVDIQVVIMLAFPQDNNL